MRKGFSAGSPGFLPHPENLEKIYHGSNIIEWRAVPGPMNEPRWEKMTAGALDVAGGAPVPCSSTIGNYLSTTFACSVPRGVLRIGVGTIMDTCWRYCAYASPCSLSRSFSSSIIPTKM